MNKNKLTNLKLVAALFSIGVSFGAYALPGLNTCNYWCEQCIAEGDDFCSGWWSGKCYRYTGSNVCFPEP